MEAFRVMQHIYAFKSWYAINKEKDCGDDPRSPKEHDAEVVRQKTLRN